MKKTLIPMLIIAAFMCAACGSTAADTSTAQEPETVENTEVVYPEYTPSYISNQVTITDIAEEMLTTTLSPEDAENPNNEIDYILSTDTLVYDSTGNKLAISALQVGDLVTVYTSSYAPAALVLPVEYQADIVIIERTEEEAEGFTCADTFIIREEMLTAMGNTLALNLSDETIVVDAEDNTVDFDLENKDLLVFYTNSTRSIPAQTTPVKIVLLGENEMAIASLNAD